MFGVPALSSKSLQTVGGDVRKQALKQNTGRRTCDTHVLIGRRRQGSIEILTGKVLLTTDHQSRYNSNGTETRQLWNQILVWCVVAVRPW